MLKTLIEAPRHCPRSLLFCAALAVGGALYGQRLLATWADRTESRLVVLCLVGKEVEASPGQLLAGLKRDDTVRQSRLVEPEEVASWVSEAAREAGTTATLPLAIQPAVRRAAIELTYRGAVRAPARFAETLRALRANPAFERVFFDAAGQDQTAQFYALARGALRGYLLLVLVGALAAELVAILAARRRQSRIAPVAGPLHGSGPAGRTELAQAAVALLRATTPAIAGWLCLFAILLLWPLPPPDGLPAGDHLFALVATVILVELSALCAAALARHLV